jgi:protein TonB
MAPPDRKQPPDPAKQAPRAPARPAFARPAFARPPLRERLRGWRPTVLQLAFSVSIALHLAVLGVRIVDPQDFNRVFQDTPLELVLVNARSQEAPTKAQAIAQARLAGGGEATLGLATSPLPPSPTVAEGDAQEETHQHMEQLIEEQEQLLEQTRKALALLPVPDPRKASQTPEERQQEEHRQQLLRQFAAIDKAIQQENSRPRRRYVSPATEEKVYAIYMDTMRQRIEAHGTSHTPTQNGHPLHGSLFVNVVVSASGKVLDAKVMEGSGLRALDQRAVEIARSAGPFPKFTTDMAKLADEIEFTWRFDFSGANGLIATPQLSADPGG